MASKKTRPFSRGTRARLGIYGCTGWRNVERLVLSATVLDHLTKANDRHILTFFFDFSREGDVEYIGHEISRRFNARQHCEQLRLVRPGARDWVDWTCSRMAKVFQQPALGHIHDDTFTITPPSVWAPPSSSFVLS